MEVRSQKNELEKNHRENVKYLKSIPKNPLEGFVGAGKAIGGSLFWGSMCLIAVPYGVVHAIWDRNPDSSKLSKVGKSIVLTPFALAGGLMFGAANIIGGVGSGVASIGHGIAKGVKNMVSSNGDEMKDINEAKSSDVIQHVLDDKKVKIKEVPFLKQLYGNFLRTGFMGDIQ